MRQGIQRLRGRLYARWGIGTVAILLALVTLLLPTAACDKRPEVQTPEPASTRPDTAGGATNKYDSVSVQTITIAVGEERFAATLEGNATSKAFRALLPLTLPMTELNGNEKYHYLGGSLPSAPGAVGRIEAGDLMLYGDKCLVLFYKGFTTSYTYTRIGRVANPERLASALGGGDVTITITN